MAYRKTVDTFLSNDKKNTIKYYVYEPEGEIKAMLQLSHGMCEYVERYEPHIEYFTSQGILVFGNDHLGHKGSVKSDDDLGFMGSYDGWKYMYEDIHSLTEIMRSKYPHLPLFLFGHSMGSCLARAVIGKYGKDYRAAIICGTGGTNKVLGLGLTIIRISRRLRGEHTRSALLSKLTFSGYNKRYDKVRTPQDWLSRDEAVVDAYRKDKYCMFTFTTAAFEDLLTLFDHVSQDKWYDSVPNALPVFLISGEMDPVGGFGEGVKEVYERLCQHGSRNCKMKLYPGMRHEILNEIGKEEVYEDIVNFIENN